MEGELSRAFQMVSQPNNAIIKEGTNLLASLKKDNSYPLALLQYMNNTSILDEGKLRAAIELRIWCQRYKELETFQRSFYNQYIQGIKQSILFAYLNFPLKISKTIRPGIICLADVLFPNEWTDLISNLLNYASQVPTSIKAVLKMIQNISFKYTYLTRSDPLYEQIILMCDQVHDFLMNLTTNILQRVLTDSNNTNQVQILELLMKIFYNLNYQDLHPKFQDNLQRWMNILKAIMNLNNINQQVFKCKGAALQSILLYASKYKEDVEEPIRGFCQEIWLLCAGASEDTEYDQIVFSSLKFFKSLVLWPDMKGFFTQNMDSLIQNLILPNIGVTKISVALFQQQIDTFIDFYFRNTEIQTRRSAALELLRVICRHYTSFQPFLINQLSNFNNMKTPNVKAECTILSLTIDGCSKGFRDVDGCTQLFVNPQIIQHCYHNIVKKILSQIYGKIDNGPIQKNFTLMHVAILIRFLFYFRIYFPKEELNSIVQFLTSIHTESTSLRKIIYLTINGFLIMRHGDYNSYKNLVPYFNSSNLKSIAINIFKVIYEGTKIQNFLQQGLTKMFFNLSKALAQSNYQFYSIQIEIIREMLKRTVIFDFNSVHFLFETMGFQAYWYLRTNSSNKEGLQSQIFNYFQIALKNKSDLVNFCLQIFAIFLQLQPATSNQYHLIYNGLLQAENWKQQNQSIMSSYIQFIITFISKHKERLLTDKSAIEVILSKIIEIDHVQLFYRFLEAIMTHTTLDQFYNSGYLNIMIQGGQIIAKNSIQGRKASLLFICKLLTYYNDINALNMMNSCCHRFFDQLLQVSGDILRSISLRRDRRYIFVSICNAIKANYFNDLNILGQILNDLICNTVDRFNMRNITSFVQENESKEKKESTYKKLQVFKQFEKPENDLQIEQQEYFVSTFQNLMHQMPEILNIIEPKNKERMKRLNDKYSKFRS